MHRGTLNNSIALRLMGRISSFCVLVCLDCTNYNEINVHFPHAQKHITNRILYTIHNLSTRPHERIGIYRGWSSFFSQGPFFVETRYFCEFTYFCEIYFMIFLCKLNLKYMCFNLEKKPRWVLWEKCNFFFSPQNKHTFDYYI